MDFFTRIFGFLLSHWEVVSGAASAVIAPVVFFWRRFDRRIRRREIELSQQARDAEAFAAAVRRDLSAAIEQIRRVQDQGGVGYLNGVVGGDNGLWHKVTFEWVEAIAVAERLCATHGVRIDSGELCRLIDEHRASGHWANLGVWAHRIGQTPCVTSGRLGGACSTVICELAIVITSHDDLAKAARVIEANYKRRSLYSHLRSALTQWR